MPLAAFADRETWLDPLRRLRQDFRRYRNERRATSLGRIIMLCLFDRGFHFVFSRRLQEWLYFTPLLGRVLRRVLWYMTCMYYGAEIAIAAQVGGGLYIPHPAGVVIGRARIGPNVTIEQGVTLGQRSPRHPENPTIEPGVRILQGAVVLGGVTVRRDTVIPPRVVVTQGT